MLRTHRLLSSLVLLVGAPFFVRAQSELDIWRFSSLSVFGTARGQALGGAMSAVGADFSSALTNPAGFGLYRGSEVTLTPVFRTAEAATDYLDGSTLLTRSQFGLGQAGYVKHTPIYEAGERRTAGWKSWTLGIGYTQTENYNRDTRVIGFNPYNSLSDFYAWQANLAGGPANGVRGSIAAYEAFVYDDDLVNGGFRTSIQDEFGNGGFVDQEISFEERGRMGQWTIAFAGNWSDRVYLGGSINIADISNNSRLLYSEFDVFDVYQDSIRNDTSFQVGSFSNWLLAEELDVSGIGISLSFGIIAQVTDYLRLSAAFHSPTWGTVTTTYLTEVYLQDDSGLIYPDFFENSELGEYRYNIATPYRFTGGAMVLLGKIGFLSADVEYIDYPSAQLSSAPGFDADFSATNTVIDEQSASALNVRLGGELKLSNLYLRGGYAYFGPIRNATGETYLDAAQYSPLSGTAPERVQSSKRTAYTGGIGYRTRRFSADLAYVYQTQAQQYSLYSLPEDFPALGYGVAPVVVTEEVIHRVLFTLGFRLPK